MKKVQYRGVVVIIRFVFWQLSVVLLMVQLCPRCLAQKRTPLIEALDKTIEYFTKNGNQTFPSAEPARSFVDMKGGDCTMVTRLCSGMMSARHGCCRANFMDFHIIHNVQFRRGKMVSFQPPNPANCDRKYVPQNGVPAISYGSTDNRFTVKRNTIEVETSNDHFPPKNCQQVVNGTLHIQNRHIPKVLFHAMNDNVLVFMSLVMLDAHYFPEYARRPRWFLELDGGEHSKALPHYKNFLHGAVDRVVLLKSLQGVCFRRVLVGKPFASYHTHLMVSLRRQTAQLMANYVGIAYPNPRDEAREEARGAAKRTEEVNLRDGRDGKGKLYIAIISRVEYGRGIMDTGEEDLVAALKAKGHIAFRCCSFSPFERQFTIWKEVDVIIGMHGAGLTNAAFARRGVAIIELKGNYGYPDRAYHTVADSRVGRHVQIDMRSTMNRAKFLYVMTPQVIQRILNALSRLQSGADVPIGETRVINKEFIAPEGKEQYDMENGMCTEAGDSGHILGPLLSQREAYCKNLPFWDENIYWIFKDNKKQSMLKPQMILCSRYTCPTEKVLIE